MKKKSLAILLLITMAFTAVACGSQKGAETQQQPAASEAVPVEAVTAEEPVASEEPAATETTETTEEAAAEESSEATEETAAEEGSAANLPAYEYPGPELFYYVLYQYLVDELAGNYPQSDVSIPCPIIMTIDESDKADIKVYGDFWMFNYNLEGDKLMNSSGGAYPGCIHMKCDENGYEVTSMEVVGDGSDYEPTAKKIFGDLYDELYKVTADEKGREEIRAQIIANYVAANNLSITAYQDFGWDPVPLPEENIDNFYSTDL